MLSVLTYSIVNQPRQNNEIVEFITGGGAPAEQIRWLNLTTIVAFPPRILWACAVAQNAIAPHHLISCVNVQYLATTLRPGKAARIALARSMFEYPPAS